MASEADFAEISSLSERLRQNGNLSFLVPLIVEFADSETRENPDQESPDQSRERLILIDPSTRSAFVINIGLDTLLNLIEPGKQGRPPAAKSAVEAMPRVEIEKEEGEDGGACVICLEEWSEGETATEMPCKHRFHVKCIEEWLGIHGTCPVCRYEMPVEEEEKREKNAESETGLIRFFINGGGRREDGEGRETIDHSS